MEPDGETGNEEGNACQENGTKGGGEQMLEGSEAKFSKIKLF